jgi:ferritin-like metal-binding protein YciE
MALDSLRELLIEEMRDLYSAETQLVKALPKMAKAASHEELQAAITEHLEVTKNQVNRLTEIFDELEESPKGKTCKAMQGLIEEGEEIIQEDGEDAVKDAALICAAQKVEHYEIAAYGCVRTYANLLGLDSIGAKLQETLDEEGEADKSLTELAETIINVEAEEADDDEEESEDAKINGAKRRSKVSK